MPGLGCLTLSGDCKTRIDRDRSTNECRNSLEQKCLFDVFPTLDFQELEALPTSPITLRIIAEEMDGNMSKDKTNVEVAIIIDDVVNRKPKFLKNQ